MSQCKVQMFGTKVEITLVKAEPGTWAKLDFPRDKQPAGKDTAKQQQQKEGKKGNEEQEDDNGSDVDLDDLEPTLRTATITELN